MNSLAAARAEKEQAVRYFYTASGETVSVLSCKPLDLNGLAPPRLASAEPWRAGKNSPEGPKTMNGVPNPAQVDSAKLAKEREAARQAQTSDPEQAKAERERRIQQLPPELQALIRDPSLLDARTAEKSTAAEDRAERLRRLEEERRKTMSAIASPNRESSDTQPGSPSPSPTPE
jgi:hypothetical protein